MLAAERITSSVVGSLHNSQTQQKAFVTSCTATAIKAAPSIDTAQLMPLILFAQCKISCTVDELKVQDWLAMSVWQMPAGY